MHTIAVDRCKRTISVKHAGFYDVARIELFYRELLAAIASHFGDDPDYAILIDVADCRIQSQEAIRAFQEGIAHCPPARKIAVVAHGALARMQMRRVIARDYLRNFDGAEDAARWLEAA